MKMTTEMMRNNELNEMELEQVNGGANEEKTIADILEDFDYDVENDPFHFPGPYLPWDPRQYQLPDYDPSQLIA